MMKRWGKVWFKLGLVIVSEREGIDLVMIKAGLVG